MRSALAALLACLCVPALAAERSVIIDSAKSSIKIHVEPNVDKFTANVSSFEAAIKIDAASGRATSAHVRFDFNSIRTGKPDRDSAMNEWENAAKYPEVTYTLTHLRPGAGSSQQADGIVTLHGVDRPVSFPVTITVAGDRVVIDGQSVIDTRDFGLPVIKKFLVLTVDPHLTVFFHLEGALARP